MKTILTTLLLIIAISSQAQYRVIRDVIDPFDKARKIEVRPANLSGGSLTQFNIITMVSLNYIEIDGKGADIFIMFKVNAGGIKCLREDSKLSFLLSNGEIVTLYRAGSVDCGTMLFTGYILQSEDDLLALSKWQVSALRIYFTDTYRDYEVPINASTKVSEGLRFLIDSI